MVILWPYLKTRGVKSEGLRWYAVGYLVAFFAVIIFWFWWAFQPAPVASLRDRLPTFPPITPMIYDGFEDLFITITPLP